MGAGGSVEPGDFPQQLEKRGQNCLSCASMKHPLYADVESIEVKGQIFR